MKRGEEIEGYRENEKRKRREESVGRERVSVLIQQFLAFPFA